MESVVLLMIGALVAAVACSGLRAVDRHRITGRCQIVKRK
jgi:hypothetical protein